MSCRCGASPRPPAARSSASRSRTPSWRANSLRRWPSWHGSREAAHVHTHEAIGSVEQRIKAIVDDALPGKRVEVDDNLFEIGASSLTLIQIHERIDREFPGLVDLTEIFDFPTVADLASHIEAKLAQRHRLTGASADARTPATAQTATGVIVDAARLAAIT